MTPWSGPEHLGGAGSGKLQGFSLRMPAGLLPLAVGDGAVLVLDRHTRRLFPFLETIFAVGADGGAKLRRAMADAAWRIEVVKRSAQAKGFEVIPRRSRRGTPHRLDQPLPAPRQGLRKPQPNRHRPHPTGEHQAHAPKTYQILLSLMNFPDGLSHVRIQDSGQDFPSTVSAVPFFDYSRRT